MKSDILDAYRNFQIADFDDDLIGLSKSVIEWMKVLRAELPNETFPENNPPDNYYKLHPHFPRYELRLNIRDGLNFTVNHQKEDEYSVKLLNIYVLLLVITYLYHLPTEQIIKKSLEDNDIDRDIVKEMLLDDGMSPNWIKEPSGKDFSLVLK